jgi:serpin B
MMRKTTLIAFIFLCAGFVSCKKGNNTQPKLSTGKNLILTPLEQQKATTDNAFSFKLYNAIGAGDNTTDNILVSPLSISFAVAMTSNGANGETLTGIRNAMDFNGFSQADLNAYYNNLITNMPELDPNTTLNIANSIWYKQGADVLPAFIAVNTESYKAKVQALDFSSASAVQTINNWVSTETNGKIPTILNNIPSNAFMYLINALYFKSNWNEKFDASATAPASFYLADGSTVQNPFMHSTVDANVYHDSNVSVIELPYSNKKYSMVIVEPAATTTLKELTAGLDSTKWAGWMSSLSGDKVQVALPKFSFSYSILLNDALKSLGMSLAFSDQADFSNISATRLQISAVQHKTFVAVDETGTTAAAATSVGVVSSAEPVDPVSYTINHPFIFVIREMNTGLVLFTGEVNNPTLKGE